MRQSYIEELLKKPAWMFFLFSWLFYLIGLFLFSHLVWDSNTYLYDYKGNDFEEWLSSVRRIDLVRYVLSPLWVITISAVIWILIKAGLVVSRIEFNTALLFKIIFLGFFFISLPFWIKSVWLILFEGSYTPDRLKYFFPGSMVSFVDTSEMKLTMVKAISRFNLFHLSFMLFTAWMISFYSPLNYIRSFLLVFSTYGFGLALLQCIIIVIAM
ncbi:MAG: hypothetical protein Q8N05_13555 [Bacteroidota bacterium]|nr:hypothetical protein [Bacteroidota bacterium]